jgi:hypothetical protein
MDFLTTDDVTLYAKLARCLDVQIEDLVPEEDEAE